MNIVVFRTRIPSLFASNIINMLGTPSILSVFGGRMLFNLKEVGEQGLKEGTSYRVTPSRTISEIEFA